MRARLITAGLFAAAAIALAGCNADANANGDGLDTPTSSSTSPTASPTETSTVTPEEQAVLDAYDAFYAALAQAYADPAQSQVHLEPVATGAQFEQANSSIKANFLAGEETVGSPVRKPVVDSIEGDTAVVHDCQDTTKVIRRKIGSTEPLVIGRNPDSVETTLKMVGGVWKVAATEYKEPAGVYCS